MTETSDPRPYEQIPPPRKSRRVWWILGGLALVLILLGTCIKGGIDAFGAINARSQATTELAKDFMANGLAAADDPIYSRRAGVTPEAVENLNRLIGQYGKTSAFTSPTCGMVSSANINAAASGTFSTCTLSAKAELSPVDITVQWVREDETWKLLGFQINYTDNTVLLEKAERLDALNEPEAE